MDINSKLAEKGIVLPDAPPPAANYIPFVKVDKLVFISGQVSQNKREIQISVKRVENN